MTRQRSAKPGALGPAFHAWLEWLEHVEHLVLGTGPMKGKQLYMAMNNDLFHTQSDDEYMKMMSDVAPVDAYNARIVRSSTKYKVEIATLMQIVQKYKPELDYIRNTSPINLPFEWCTLVITGFGKDDILICVQESEAGKDYPELHVEAGDKFIDCNIAFYRAVGVELMDSQVHPEQKLSYCPVELHFNKGMLESETTFLNAIADGVRVNKQGQQVIEMIRTCILVWIHSFHLSSMLRRRQMGIPATPGKLFKRKRLRKKRNHPHFEHFIVELEVDEPDPEQEGRSVFQPRKRMHQVRGFYRHYKSGKVSWVKPHWRGDETLGVVKKDYEVMLHDEELE